MGQICTLYIYVRAFRAFVFLAIFTTLMHTAHMVEAWLINSGIINYANY